VAWDSTRSCDMRPGFDVQPFHVWIFSEQIVTEDKVITEEPTRCNNNLLIYKISSTCFGQCFAHLQERETEIFTAYGILICGRQGFGERQGGTTCTVRKEQSNNSLLTVNVVPRCRSPNPCPPQQQDAICCKNISLTFLKMGKTLPETC